MSLRQLIRLSLTRGAAAIALVALASVLRIWPLQSLGSGLTWLTYNPAVMVVAIYGGFYAGFLSIVLACLTVTFLWPLFAAAPFIRDPADWLGMAVFAMTASMICGVAESMRRAQARAITAREQLRTSSDYTRSLIEASLDPLVTISPEGKITDVNKATEAATGRSRSELIGTDFSSYFTEPDKAREGYQQSFTRGFVTDYPLSLRHRDGHVAEVLYNASVFHNETGETKGVFAAARDVTERNRAEREVAQLNLRNRLILESAGEGIYGLDIEGRCTFVNAAASQLLGFSVDELVGQSSHAMFHHTKSDGRPYPVEECPVHAAYKSGMVNRGSDVYWRKDGSRFPVDFISTPIMEAGKLAGAVVAFRDITERKQAEAAIQRLNAELEQRVMQRTAQIEAANKELEEFSYSMSHEMRTPLRALDGFSQMLLDQYSPALDDEGKRLVKVLRGNATRMARLIDDLLHFISIGRQKIAFNSLDIAMLASEVFNELQADAPGRRVHLVIGALPPAQGDRKMLREVLQHLMSNAIKFSSPDAEQMIEIGGEARQDENIYSVRDHGIGFDMRYADKLFKVFERVHPTGQYEGSGIGLAIVKRIITLHGGRVWAEGREGEGATFHFTLPRAGGRAEHGESPPPDFSST